MPSAAGIYYAEFDEGHKDQPPVILIHGAGSNHLIWPAEIRRLSGQRVLAVDLPGHGRSGGVAQHSIPAYASQMIEFLGALGLYQAVFVGHSMGGAIALELAVNHGEHVAGLGLIATGAYLGVDAQFLEHMANPITIPTAIQMFKKQAFGPKTPASWVERCMEALTKTRPSVLYGDWRACADFDLREQITQAEAPAWVIAGSDDRLTPIAYAHFLAGRLPAARIQIIAGCGHMVMLEAPKAVAQGLQQFLAALEAARTAAARVHLPANPVISSLIDRENRARY
ncbi:MAG: alpha/beta fold hydrolase [Chloroflexi bacterium]|nr:alpha/beta fold hydrolase [Chloroflexota bacterium]